MSKLLYVVPDAYKGENTFAVQTIGEGGTDESPLANNQPGKNLVFFPIVWKKYHIFELSYVTTVFIICLTCCMLYLMPIKAKTHLRCRLLDKMDQMIPHKVRI